MVISTHKPDSKKFNLSDNDLCPRCGEVEDREHLIIECPSSKALWSKSIEMINVVHNTSLQADLPTILNLNHNSDSRAITTVIAYINHWNIYSKPDRVTSAMIKNKLAQLIRLERGFVKNAKKHEKKWQKWMDYLDGKST
jgi:hypothetical protein